VFILLYLCLGAVLTVAAFFLLRRRAAYREVTIYEVTDGMVPPDKERLLEMDREPKPVAVFARNSCSYRRELRLDLECLKIQFERILSNAARPRDCAYSDLRLIRKHCLEYPDEAPVVIRQVLDAERQLRMLVRRALFMIWLWSLSGFHRRGWGPVPDLQKFQVGSILEAYGRVRLAAISLARCYGEAAVSEEIAASM
jgi:hypothetical protein